MPVRKRPKKAGSIFWKWSRLFSDGYYKREAPARTVVSVSALSEGAVTYFPTFAVSSAWQGLTSLFGMGRGGALTLWPPWSLAGRMPSGSTEPDIRRYGGRQRGGAGNGFTDSQSAGRMRPRGADGGGFPSYATRGLSFGACAPERVRAISTAWLCASPRLHLRPIYVVVSDGPIGDLILGGAS